TPEVAYALGVVLGELYRRGALEASHLRDEARKKAMDRLNHEFRDPASRILRAVQDRPALEVPELAEALLAFHQGSYDQALELARKASAQAPWLYESHKLEGDIQMT